MKIALTFMRKIDTIYLNLAGVVMIRKLMSKNFKIFISMLFFMNTLIPAPISKSYSQGLIIQWNIPIYEDLFNTPLPSQVGRVNQSWKSTQNQNPPVIIIQDSHANYSAQKNVSFTLEHLLKNNELLSNDQYELKIGVEGSSGDIELSYFESIPDQKLRADIMDFYMQQGKISGVEYFSILQDENIKLFGIEDEGLYLNNKKYFVELVNDEGQFQEYWDESLKQLNGLIEKTFSGKEKDFWLLYSNRLNEKSSLFDYTDQLRAYIQKNKLKHSLSDQIQKTIEWLDLEKNINFEIVEKEERNLVNLLGDKLKGDALINLIQNSLYFQDQFWSTNEYYRYLYDVSIENHISLSPFPQWLKVVQLIQKRGQMSEADLLKDIGRLEKDIVNKTFSSQNNKIFNYIVLWSKLGNMLKLSLPRGAWDSELTQTDIKEVSDFFKSLLPSFEVQSLYLQERLDQTKEYYQAALARDQAFGNNILKRQYGDPNVSPI